MTTQRPGNRWQRSSSGRQPTRAYIDESARASYLICAVVVVGDASAIRSAVRQLPQPGSHRVHMAKESKRRRRELLTAIAPMDLQAFVATSPLAGRDSQRSARDLCLRQLVEWLVAAEVDELVIESCDQDRDDDRAVLAALYGLDATGALTYCHRRPHDEPLLWLPDMIAWAHGAGGEWAPRVAQLITRRARLAA